MTERPTPREVAPQSVSQWRGLARDPIVRLQIAVLLVVSVAYFLPTLTLDQLWLWTVSSDLPLILISVLAFQVGIGRLDRAERRFWNLWTLALAAWLVKAVVAVATWELEELQLGLELVVNIAFYLFYFFAAMALESRPHRQVGRLVEAVQAVERIGTLVFFTGLLLYLAVIPAVLDLDSYISSSLMLYVVLDLYLLIRLAGFLRGTLDPVWRRIYSWLLVTAVFWLVTDASEMLDWAGILSGFEEGSLGELWWLPAWATLVIAARVREIPTLPVARSEQPRAFRLGPLVTFTVSFPVIHFTLAWMGLANPVVEPVQEILGIVLLVVLASLVIARQELLRKETLRLEQDRVRNQREIEHLAFHDALTGVPNRRLLNDRLARGLGRARRFKRNLAVLLLDIDHFKRINDSMGHDVGDEVLRMMAKRIERCIRGGDTVARFGGDEFVVVLEGLRDREDYRRVFELMTGALAAPFEIGDHSLIVQVTIGAGLFPEHGDTLESLLKQADRAMYRAKGERDTT
jgi:diguanylate cyclase (GGDEF)-like protein